MNIQTKFQTCSHSTATSVYQTIQDIISVKSISDKLCKALTTIGTVCVKHLNECFAEDDVRQMRKSHLEEMKSFLLRIVLGKVPRNALDNCKVVEIENVIVDPIEYSYDEDDDYIIITTEMGDITDVDVNTDYEVEIETQNNLVGFLKLREKNSMSAVDVINPDMGISKSAVDSYSTTDISINTGTTGMSYNTANIHDSYSDIIISTIANSDLVTTARTINSADEDVGRTEIVIFDIEESDEGREVTKESMFYVTSGGVVIFTHLFVVTGVVVITGLW